VEHLGSPPADEIFRSGYLSVVIGLRLADDRAVVVKARDRLQAGARAYDAKYQHAAGQPVVSLSEHEARDRLRRARTA
jgi:hypothetical protein